MSTKAKKTVFVIYYSMFGHVQKLAIEVCKGLEKAGVIPRLFQVAETLPQEVLDRMHAPQKPSNVPIITAEQLAAADGILFGLPTRFGMVPAQMKAFFDSCGQLWMSGALVNKFVGTFFSTGSLGAGQESTALTTLPFFAHMGMIYVPIGGKHKSLGDISVAHGGSAWGAGTITGGDGTKYPSDLELEIAHFQGYDFGTIVKRTNFS